MERVAFDRGWLALFDVRAFALSSKVIPPTPPKIAFGGPSVDEVRFVSADAASRRPLIAEGEGLDGDFDAELGHLSTEGNADGIARCRIGRGS